MHSYDVGGSLLFDDRSEEIIIHDPLVKKQLPTKKPDRVYGLKKTKAFAKLLDTEAEDNDYTFRCSPFKDFNDPLLFPFLIIEAKPEKMSVGFEEARIQTALPIWGLLKLQESLSGEVSQKSDGATPLVWYFASRGDSWRVYGCYITQTQPKNYVSFNGTRTSYPIIDMRNEHSLLWPPSHLTDNNSSYCDSKLI